MLGVGVLAPDADIDLADAVPLPLDDAIDKIEFTRLFQKPRVGLDVGEDEAPAAVDVADGAQISIHRRLVEKLTAGQLQIPFEELALEPLVADERDVPDPVARSFIDDKGQQGPVAADAVHHLHFAAHPGLEEAEAAVIGGQGVDVAVNLFIVDIAAEEPKEARL